MCDYDDFEKLMNATSVLLVEKTQEISDQLPYMEFELVRGTLTLAAGEYSRIYDQIEALHLRKLDMIRKVMGLLQETLEVCVQANRLDWVDEVRAHIDTCARDYAKEMAADRAWLEGFEVKYFGMPQAEFVRRLIENNLTWMIIPRNDGFDPTKPLEAHYG